MSLLEALVPATVRRRIAADPRPITQPLEQRFAAAFLIADMSGFTALAERLAQRGARGAEELKDIVNLLFGRLIDLVDSWGGEVLKFAGDSTLAYWPASEPNDTRAAARAAAACALDAQAVVDAINAHDRSLKIRVGVGAGELWMADVGGIDERREVVSAGEAVATATTASTLAAAGEVVVDPTVAAHLGADARAVPLSGGGGFAKLIALSGAKRPAVKQVPTLPHSAHDELRKYVPRAVRAWLDAGQSQWLAEFRSARVVFVGIDSLDYTSPHILETVQRVTAAVQTAVHRYGGSVNQLVVDDKGTVFVCGWGLPFHTHDDDAVRAVRAALEISRALRAMDLQVALGIASDQVFTGLRGNERRTEYAMIGAAVNLAARLMQHAKSDILCDRATFEAAQKRIDFQELPPLAIKGRAGAVEIFHPIAEFTSTQTVRSTVFGRDAEQQALTERLEAVARGEGGALVLEGEAGMGKSRLIADAIERAQTMGLDVRVATGDAIERSAPYHAFRTLYESMLEAPARNREARVLELLGEDQRLLQYAALLNPVLGTSLVETDESARVSPRGRADLTRDLLIRLFTASENSAHCVLVLEDAHWFDSASWALTEGLMSRASGSLLLIGLRPVDESESAPELKRLRVDEHVQWLRLGALAPDAARDLAASRLGASSVDDALARFIFGKTEGQPFFTEELVHVLQDTRAVRVQDGVAAFADGDTAAISIPDTVEGVITSRIDMLTPPEQLTLKVASVLGRTFDLESLAAVHPLQGEGVNLTQHVESLRARDLTHPVAGDASAGSGEGTFLFKHVITQDVAYGMLPFAQRRQLHQSVAKWYEEHHAGSLEPFYPLLAHHWGRSEIADKTAHYLEKAGDQSFARYGNQEAARFFGEALELEARAAAELPDPEPVALSRRHVIPGRVARRARWQRNLGEAFINLGNYIDGKNHLHAALAAMDLPVPNERAMGRALLTQLVTQTSRRFSPVRPRRYAPPAAALMREGVRACTRLGGVAYTENRTSYMLFFLVRALNVAERLPPTIELAVAYADAGNIAGVIPLHRLANRYGELARRTAAELQDPHTTARVLNRCAIYKGAIGDWSTTKDLETAMSLAEQVGDPYVWEESSAIRARVAYYQGEFETCRHLAREQLVRATASGTELHRPWAMMHEALASLRLGDIDAAFALAAQCRAIVEQRGRSDPMTLLGCDAIDALGHLESGELEGARTAAGRMLPVILGARTIPHLMGLLLSATTEAFTGLWDAEGAVPGAATEIQARQALRVLRRYARINPPAGAMALLWEGRLTNLSGQPARAQQLLAKAIAQADRRGLPFESARAHFELGKAAGLAEADSRAHLLRAREGFGRMNAARDVARVDAVLARRRLE